jgi:hypothetical protein
MRTTAGRTLSEFMASGKFTRSVLPAEEPYGEFARRFCTQAVKEKRQLVSWRSVRCRG